MAQKSARQRVRTLDDLLVPGRFHFTADKALKTLSKQCDAMQESQKLAQRVFKRLLAVRIEYANKPVDMFVPADLIVRFAELVESTIWFLRKFAPKPLVSRITSNRRFLEGVEAIHKQINFFFKIGNQTSRPEMNEWLMHWEADLDLQQQLFDSSFSRMLEGNDELTERELEDALIETNFELSKPQRTQQQETLVKRVASHYEFQMSTMFSPLVPEWLVTRDMIRFQEKPFIIGMSGSWHRGVLEETRERVVGKCVYSDSKKAQEAIYSEGELWSRLDHPNLLKMKGGCYARSPMFLLGESVGDERGFDDYFNDDEENKLRIWSLFAEVIEGLSYLHTQGIVHNNLKCSNLLVGDDGRAKLSDFRLSHVQNSRSVQAQPSLPRWRAPECLLREGPNANPTFKSDVYSLGMSIIEAKTGGWPWGPQRNEEIIELIASEVSYPRPDGAFSDAEWELVQAMTKLDPDERATLVEAAKIIAELASAETKPVDKMNANIYDHILDEPENIISDINQADLKLIALYIQRIPTLRQEHRTKFLRQVSQVMRWSKQEAK